MDHSELIEKLSALQDDKGSFSDNREGSQIFATAQILHNIIPFSKKIKNKNLDKIIAKSISFLMSQASPDITFNVQLKEQPHSSPDSLAVTFCALSSIAENAKETIDGEKLAQIIYNLTTVEIDEGGPYLSFFPSEKKRIVDTDLDLLTNAQIARFLDIFNVRLEKVDLFISKKIADKDVTSKFSSSNTLTIYWLSRIVGKESKNELLTIIDELINSNMKLTRIDVLYLVAALLKFSEHDQADKYLSMVALDAIDTSKELAVYLEILSSIHPDKGDEGDNFSAIYLDMIDTVHSRIEKLPKILGENIESVMKKIIAFDKDRQILLLSFFTKKALGKNGERIPDDLLAKIGVANLYMWIAYTIYDDFYDDEGRPVLLPAANFCLREASVIISKIMPENDGFQNTFSDLMDKIDFANTYETTYCRAKIEGGVFHLPEQLPDFSDILKLSEKSIAHSWCALAPLFYLGFEGSSHEVRQIIRFFSNYLSAKQLNDDAHDWEEDMKMGRITSVVLEILKSRNSQSAVDLNDEILQIREKFWLTTLVNASNSMLALVEEAKNSLKTLDILENKEIFYELLEPISDSANGAINEHREFTKFVKNYRK